MANVPGNPTPAARPAQPSGERSDKPSGSQPSRDRSTVGGEDRQEAAKKERIKQIKDQTRPRDPDEVKPRDTAANREPDQRDERPGNKERMSGGRLTVQALKDLWYQNTLIRAGEVFTLRDAKKFKANQMVEVDAPKKRGGREAEPLEPGPVAEGMVPGVFASHDGLTPGQRRDHDFGNAVGNAQADPEALPDPGEPPSVPPPSLATNPTLATEKKQT